MTKQTINISLDEEVLEQAKKQIPNISQFVEKCLRQYLGLDKDCMYPVTTAQELIETIKDAQIQLFLMNESSKFEENIEKANKHKTRMAWLKVWREYRDTSHYTQEIFEEACNILGVSAEELQDILDVVYVEQGDTDVKLSDWEAVYKEFGYGDN